MHTTSSNQETLPPAPFVFVCQIPEAECYLSGVVAFWAGLTRDAYFSRFNPHNASEFERGFLDATAGMSVAEVDGKFVFERTGEEPHNRILSRRWSEDNAALDRLLGVGALSTCNIKPEPLTNERIGTLKDLGASQLKGVHFLPLNCCPSAGSSESMRDDPTSSGIGHSLTDYHPAKSEPPRDNGMDLAQATAVIAQ